MAKQRKKAKAKARPPVANLPVQDRAGVRAQQPTPVIGAPPPAREPVFWFGFEVAWGKLAVARLVVFMLLALDALLQLAHAPRYGAGDFNVAQLPVMDALAPGRVLYGSAQFALAYLFVLVAFGVATRVLVPICAVVYAWLYFSSQLDSYQHHYLVLVMLAIASFVPWQRPAGALPSTPVRAWAVRLMLVVLGVMYLWAAIGKLSPAWLDGKTLAMQLTGTVGSLLRQTIGLPGAAILVVMTELALALTIWSRPGWKIAAPLGLALHVAIACTGLEIGLFAYLMIGIYVLVIPDAIWIRVATSFEGLARVLARPSWSVLGAIVACALAKLVRIEGAFAIGIATAFVPIAIAVHARYAARVPTVRVGVAHAVAILLWLVVDRTTSVAEDYYRFWGGSQRRIGSPATAEYAYRKLVELAPDKEAGHYQLGRLLVQRGAVEAGLAELREAQRLEPAIARAFVEEARVFATQNEIPRAIDSARQATFADPSDATARALLESLTRAGKAPLPDDSE